MCVGKRRKYLPLQAIIDYVRICAPRRTFKILDGVSGKIGSTRYNYTQRSIREHLLLH
jgi:hypothetical protein